MMRRIARLPSPPPSFAPALSCPIPPLLRGASCISTAGTALVPILGEFASTRWAGCRPSIPPAMCAKLDYLQPWKVSLPSRERCVEGPPPTVCPSKELHSRQGVAINERYRHRLRSNNACVRGIPTLKGMGHPDQQGCGENFLRSCHSSNPGLPKPKLSRQSGAYAKTKAVLMNFEAENVAGSA